MSNAHVTMIGHFPPPVGGAALLNAGVFDSLVAAWGHLTRIYLSGTTPTHYRSLGHPSPRPGGTIRLGHLSNLCADKGFFAVADAFDALRAARMDTTLTLAGPILEPAVAERIDCLLATHGSLVRHLGPLAGEAKLAF